MIYVGWFKTEVNRLGKLARGGGGGAAAHAQELPRVCYSTFFQTQTATAVPTTAVPTEHGYGTRLRWPPPYTYTAGFLPALSLIELC